MIDAAAIRQGLLLYAYGLAGFVLGVLAAKAARRVGRFIDPLPRAWATTQERRR